MRAVVDVRAEKGPGGRTTVTRLVSGPPLSARTTVDGVTLVASAGGPVGGDVVQVRVHVTPGARLRIGSAAAMVVQPALTGGEAVLDVEVDLDDGALLEWCPEPTVVATGARLLSRVRVRMAESAQLTLREVLVLGRHGERGGTADLSLHVERAGLPLLRQDTLYNHPAAPSAGPAVLAGHRVIGTSLHVGPASECGGPGDAEGRGGGTSRRAGPSVGAVMALAPGATLATALAADVTSVLAALS